MDERDGKLRERGDNCDVSPVSGWWCSWDIHTCIDNDTGRDRMSVIVSVRPNKCAGTDIQKAKCTSWLSVGEA